MNATKPTKADLLASIDNTVPDIVAPNLKILFVGINPGLYTAWSGYHFAHPGNRFWPALYAGGLTPALLKPDQNHQLLSLGLGITNMAPRATLRADELTIEELRQGADKLRKTIDQYHPKWIAILGVSAYRIAFNNPKAIIGRQQDTLNGANVWILPNPSGLNAHYTPVKLAEVFHQLAAASNE